MKRKTTEKVLAIAFVAVMATVVFAVGSVTAQVRSFQISSKHCLLKYNLNLSSNNPHRT